jgi:hypothetical protein
MRCSLAGERTIGATTVSKYQYGLDTLGRRKSVINSGSELGTPPFFNLYEYNDRSELA